MNVKDLKQSRFLTRADVGRGVLATIDRVTEENVAKEGAPDEMRWIVHFRELEKPLVLNNTNGQAIAGITHSDESDNWRGHKVVLYDDPNVSFGGKLVGGIRVRAPRNPPQPPPPVPRTDPPPSRINPGPATASIPVGQRAETDPALEELDPNSDVPF